MANLSLLTPREMEILILLFAGRSKPFSAEEICISEKILVFYLDYVCTKMNPGVRPIKGAWTPFLKREAATREIPREIAAVRRL